ncbi:MAG: sodium-independent anion transporter [Bacteroidota bacterium]
MDRVPYIDQSGLYALEDAVLDLQSRDVAVVLIGPNAQVRSMVERINLVPGLIPAEYVFSDFRAGKTWLSQQLDKKELAEVGKRQREAPPEIGEGIDEM